MSALGNLIRKRLDKIEKAVAKMDAQQHQHEWEDSHYGYKCECGLFYPYGSAPWEDADEAEGEEQYAEEYDPRGIATGTDDYLQSRHA